MTQGVPRVRTSRRGDVLVVTIDNPPVNAGTTPIRRGLLDAIAELDADESLRAAVIHGDHDTFIAGSDLREFGGPLPEPILPRVLEAVESSPKPVVAAIDGHALGGGFELTLACDARVATRRARLGSPEVSLGMTTGAGASQRLPRLVGRTLTLDLITSCRRIPADEALAIGVVDRVVEDDELLEAAVETARTTMKRILMEEPITADDPEFEHAAAALLERTPPVRPHVAECIRLVRAAGTRPAAELLAEERVAFDHSRLGPEAASLRHLFFASRGASRAPVSRTSLSEELHRCHAAPSSESDVAHPLTVPVLAAAVRLASHAGAGLAGLVDLVCVDELDFPRHEGGPLWWTAHLTAPERARLDGLLDLTDDEAQILEALLTEVRRDE